jgi:hypothetical protein
MMPKQNFHLLKCCKTKQAKIINGMAKISIKSEKSYPSADFLKTLLWKGVVLCGDRNPAIL